MKKSMLVLICVLLCMFAFTAGVSAAPLNGISLFDDALFSENSVLTASSSDESSNVSNVSIEDFRFSALTNKAQDYLDEIALTLEKDENGEYILYVPGEAVADYVNSNAITLQIAAPRGYTGEFSVNYTKYFNSLDKEGSSEQVLSDQGIVKLNGYANEMENNALKYSEQINVYLSDIDESFNIKLVPYSNLKSLSVSQGSQYRPVGQKDATTFYATVVKGTTVEIASQAPIKPNSLDAVASKVTIDGTEAEYIEYTANNNVGDVKKIIIQIEDELRGLVSGTYTLELKTIEADLYPVLTYDNARMSVNVGTLVELKVDAENLHGETSYTWSAGTGSNGFKDTTSGANITLDTSKAANYTMLRCNVTNTVDGLAYSTQTKPKIVTVTSDTTTPPEILTQPVAATYISGLEAEPLTLEAKGTIGGKLTYQWYSNTTNSNTGGTPIANATQVIYVPDTSVVGTTYYYCEVVDTVNKIASTPQATACVEVEVQSNELNMEGDGTAENPYQIADADDLIEIRDFVDQKYTFNNSYFEFVNDITLPAGWDPIGSNPTPNPFDSGKGMYIRPFSGILDGKNHTVTVPEGGLPLFDYVREATIKNLNIYGTKIEGYGLINEYDVDYGSDGDYSIGDPATPITATIENCTIKSGTSVKYSGFIGGYASGKNYVYINNCTVEDNVIIGYGALDSVDDNDDYSVGSLAGEFNGFVQNCTSAATVYSRATGGGLIGSKGQSMGPCQVLNSSFTSTIEAKKNAGGIIGAGYNCDNTPIVTIKNCYVNADITGGANVGGILGTEPGCVQCWSNGTGGLSDNVFCGTLKSNDENACVGGIVGFMLSMNGCNFIQNNYYLTGSADKGIGHVTYLDTSADHETASGAIYFDSSVELPDVRGIQKKNLNRTDDPLGKDAEKLAKALTADEMKDGTAAELLNGSDSSLHNWIADTEKGHPVQTDEPFAYELEISGNYKTVYYIGEELDLSLAEFTAIWSDGNTTHPTWEEVTVTGFDNTKQGYQILTVAYGAAKAEINVDVWKKAASDITVTFRLLGDEVHGTELVGTDEEHVLPRNNLTEWIKEKTYIMPLNSTVKDVFEKALTEAGFTWENASGSYVSAITTKDNVRLAEFDNGVDSGWMYTLNGVHSDLSLREQYLEDGDVIVWHYTDNYKLETPNENIEDHRAATKVEKLISAIGDVTKDSGAAIDAARAGYDALSDAQKKLVDNYDVLTAAEAKYAELNKPTEDPKDEVEVIDPSDLPFTDVKADAWYANAVAYVYSHGLMNGTGAAAFTPEEKLNRAMMVTILYRIEGEPAVSSVNPFTDVVYGENSAWYYDAVLWAYQNGIVKGMTETTFEPTTGISREQMATMMYRYAQYKKADMSVSDDLAAFSDAAMVQSYAKDAMKWSVGKGLINGMGDGTLAPQGDATRAQAATILMRFHQNVK